ncbi:MAG: NADH-quinone oxidoreductase subunit NuoK [Candidatus Lambdaproteobacteria bacterium]|nr:NADH-quinone oxidoreductase subunit NuoK [Candidatus Lambdaproteobacteria bacterium]
MPVAHILILSAILFTIGVSGVVIRRNAIVVFMCIELMLNAVNLGFVGFAYGMQSMVGIMFVFFVLVVAAAEAVVGLAIMLEIFRTRDTLNIDEFNLLKW